jgi:hypothetical protein
MNLRYNVFLSRIFFGRGAFSVCIRICICINVILVACRIAWLQWQLSMKLIINLWGVKMGKRNNVTAPLLSRLRKA